MGNSRIVPIQDQPTVQYNSINTKQKLFAFDLDTPKVTCNDCQRSLMGLLLNASAFVYAPKQKARSKAKLDFCFILFVPRCTR